MTIRKESMANTKGEWYSARLMFESAVEDESEIDPLCEDRVVLFFETNQRSATTAAKAYGKSAEHSYRNQLGDLVKWRFREIDSIEPLSAVPQAAGWEVASRFFRRSDLAKDREAENRATEIHSAAVERAISRKVQKSDHEK